MEKQLALTKSWQPTEWFGPQAWFRSVIDLKEHLSPKKLRITDWKTGKVNQNEDKMFYQLELYALDGFIEHPKVEKVESRLFYTDHNLPQVRVYGRDELTKLKVRWLKRVKPMLAEERFDPTPGRHCTYCHYRKANGGPCIY